MSVPVTPVPQGETTQDERTMATLAHALQIVGWWIAPLIIFALRRQSRFVSFHALQALFLQLIYLAIGIGGALLWLALVLLAIMHAAANQAAGPPSAANLMAAGFLWLIWMVWMVMWAGMLVLAIVFAIKAGRGEWAEYPLVGRWARRALHM